MIPHGMLLAAGLGTRLGPLSQERPKPLLPLVDVPVIRYGLDLLRASGITRIAINLHHMGEQIREEIGDEAIYSEESEILGTGGGIKRMAELLGGERFVVINAKVAVDLDLPAVIDGHERRGALATMVVRPDPDSKRWGAIDVDATGRVRGMLAEGRHMFTGIHVIERALVARIPQGPCDIVRTAYAEMVAARGPLFAHALAEGAFFAENSTPQRYLQANLALLDGAWRAPWPTTGVSATAVVDGTAVLDEPVRVGAGARVGPGAWLRRCVVGRDAVVEAGARVHDAVLWPGAVARGEISRCVLTPRGRVDAG